MCQFKFNSRRWVNRFSHRPPITFSWNHIHTHNSSYIRQAIRSKLLWIVTVRMRIWWIWSSRLPHWNEFFKFNWLYMCVCVCLSVSLSMCFHIGFKYLVFNSILCVCVSVFNCAVEKLIGNIEMFPTAVIFVAGRTFLRRCQPATKLAPPNLQHPHTHNRHQWIPDISRYIANTRHIEISYWTHCAIWMTINTYQTKWILDVLFNLQILGTVFPKDPPQPLRLKTKNQLAFFLSTLRSIALHLFACIENIGIKSLSLFSLPLNCHDFDNIIVCVRLLFSALCPDIFVSEGWPKNYKVNIYCLSSAKIVCFPWRCLFVFRFFSSVDPSLTRIFFMPDFVVH